MAFKFEEGEQIVVVKDTSLYKDTQGIIIAQETPYKVRLYNADQTELYFDAADITSIWSDTDMGQKQRQVALLNYQASKISQQIRESSKREEIMAFLENMVSDGITKEEAHQLVDLVYDN